MATPTAAQTQPRPRPGRRVDFWLVFTGQALSMQGDGLSNLALLWWIAQETGSVAVAATLTLASTIPVIVLGPVAGAVIDRFSRRHVMMVTDVVRAIAAGFLAWGIVAGTMQMGMMVMAATVSSAARAFHRPALQASLPQLVEEEGLNHANSLFQIAEAGANLIAPPVGGVLVGLLGAGAVMGITAATYVAAAVTLLFAVIPMVAVRPQTAMATQASVGTETDGGTAEATDMPAGADTTAAAPGAGWRRLLSETGDGLRYLWTGQKMLFFMLLSFALVNFALVPLGPLAPFLAEQRLGLDAQGLGLLMAGLPVGTLLGAGIISVLGSRFHRGKGVIWGVTILGVAQAGLSLTRSAVVAIPALIAMGLTVSIANISSNGLFQTHVPHEMQGRVFAVRSSIAQAASPLALAFVGALADIAQPSSIILIGGLLAAGAGLLGYVVPGLRNAM